MKLLFYYLNILFIGSLLISCSNNPTLPQGSEKPELESVEIQSIDTFHIDEHDVNSDQLREFQRNSNYNMHQQIEI